MRKSIDAYIIRDIVRMSLECDPRRQRFLHEIRFVQILRELKGCDCPICRLPLDPELFYIAAFAFYVRRWLEFI
jgi:hypothetical protein